MAKGVPSPCIDVCRFKGDTCVGCGRTRKEIREWHRMKRKEQLLTARRAEQRARSFKD